MSAKQGQVMSRLQLHLPGCVLQVRLQPTVTVHDLGKSRNNQLRTSRDRSGQLFVSKVLLQLGQSQQVTLEQVPLKNLVAFAHREQLAEGGMLTEQWLLGKTQDTVTVEVVCADGNPAHLQPTNLRVIVRGILDRPQPQLPPVCFAPQPEDEAKAKRLCGKPAVAGQHTCAAHQRFSQIASQAQHVTQLRVFFRWLQLRWLRAFNKQSAEQPATAAAAWGDAAAPASPPQGSAAPGAAEQQASPPAAAAVSAAAAPAADTPPEVAAAPGTAEEASAAAATAAACYDWQDFEECNDELLSEREDFLLRDRFLEFSTSAFGRKILQQRCQCSHCIATAMAAAAGSCAGVQPHEVGGCSDPSNCCSCLAAKVQSVASELRWSNKPPEGGFFRRFHWADIGGVFFPTSGRYYLRRQLWYGIIPGSPCDGSKRTDPYKGRCLAMVKTGLCTKPVWVGDSITVEHDFTNREHHYCFQHLLSLGCFDQCVAAHHLANYDRARGVREAFAGGLPCWLCDTQEQEVSATALTTAVGAAASAATPQVSTAPGAAEQEASTTAAAVAAGDAAARQASSAPGTAKQQTDGQGTRRCQGSSMECWFNQCYDNGLQYDYLNNSDSKTFIAAMNTLYPPEQY